MRIATFNVENLEIKSRSGVGLGERLDILRPQFERLKADIVCLQEVNGERAPGETERSLRALHEVLRGTRYEDFHMAVSRGLDGRGVADKHNLVVLSRFPIRSHAGIRHHKVPPFSHRLLTADPPETQIRPVEFDRPVLMVEIELSSGPLYVLNVHMRAPLASSVPGQKLGPFAWKSVAGWAEGFFLSAMKRTGQALELRFALEDIFDRDPHAMVVVCGDFNAEDHEMPMKIVVGAEEDTGNGRLAARSLVVVDRAIARDRRFSVLHHGRPQMLDHMLASRALTARLGEFECHNETLSDELVGYAKIEGSVSSYHAPLVAEFDLD